MGRAGRKVESGLGAKMRTARLARGLGLRDLAVQVGMSPSSLSEFETGKSVPGPARLEALAHALGVAHAAPAAEEVRSAEFKHWRQFEPVRLGPVRSAALELFVELGYHGATMRMIAERCNMTVAGVYLHVSRKEELLTDLLERTTDEVLARLRAASAEAESAEQRLSNLVECMVLFHIYRLPMGFLASSELRSLDDDHRERIRNGRAEMREIIRAAVASCRGSGSSAVADETTARAIATMCVGVMDWWDAAGRPDPAGVAADFAVLALAMVRAVPEESRA